MTVLQRLRAWTLLITFESVIWYGKKDDRSFWHYLFVGVRFYLQFCYDGNVDLKNVAFHCLFSQVPLSE